MQRCFTLVLREGHGSLMGQRLFQQSLLLLLLEDHLPAHTYIHTYIHDNIYIDNIHTTYRYISSASFLRAASSAAYILLFFRSSNISRNFLLYIQRHTYIHIHTYIHSNTYILINLRVTPSASLRSNSSLFNLWGKNVM